MNLTEVVFVTKAKDDLASGGWIEVECIESAQTKGSVLGGKWCFVSVNKDGDGVERRSRIVTRRNAETKVIGTFKGLGNFALELGIEKPEMPLSSGLKGIWKRENRVDVL